MSRKFVVRLIVAVLVVAVAVVGFAVWWTSGSSEKRAALAAAEHEAPEAALLAVLHCLEKEPGDPDLLRTAVRLKNRSNAPPIDVEPLTERWVAAAPNDPAALRARMDVLQRLKRLADAIEPGERLLKLTPGDNDTRLQLAQCYLAVGRYDDSARECRTLIDSSSFPLGELRVCLARIESARGNFAEAGRLLDQVLSREPNLNSALLMRGVVYQQAGEDAQAVIMLKRVAPESLHERVMVLHHLGQSLARSGQPAEAKKAFDEMVIVQDAQAAAVDARLMPNDKHIQVRAGRSLLAAGWAQDGARVLEGALDRLGPDREMLIVLAECYDKLGAKQKSLDMRNRAARIP
ncbi:MAG TPA: tetratricopeptide repeat protein [Gemmataceae bacterium]|jgi:predicted Zn-dependent protease|nr:tetratricopeptide repeat protein [Gemmataceae bacterium]